jgi:hypothetical protein
MRDDAGRGLAATAVPALAAAAKHKAKLDQAVGRDLVSQWGADGTDLARRADAADAVLLDTARGRGPVIDGRRLTSREEGQLGFDLFDHLALQCSPPPSGWRAAVDGALSITPVDLALETDGESVLRRTKVDGNGVAAAPDLLAKGKVITFPSANDAGDLAYADRGALWVASGGGAPPRRVSADGERWDCPRWTADGRHLVGEHRTGTASWTLSMLEVAAGTVTSVAPPTSHRKGACASPLDPNTLLLNDDDPTTGFSVVESLGLDDTGRHHVASLPDCNVVGPVASADRLQIVADVGCLDPYQSGVWTFPVAGGPPHQVVGGHISAATWLPDGHLVFGLSPLGSADVIGGLRLWVADADGSHLHRITGLPDTSTTWPVGIPTAR